MLRLLSTTIAASSLLLCVLGCSSSGSSGGGAASCPAGFDAGQNFSGPEGASEGNLCGNLLTGTKGQGEACQNNSECQPTCCACPNAGHSAQAAWCAMGQCITGPDVCCGLLLNAGPDGGVPFVCQ